MMSLLRKVAKSAVTRFWATYMLVCFLALGVCVVGFEMAFGIVRSAATEERRHVLSQGVTETENMLENMYRFGMQISLSAPVQEIARTEVARDASYYYATQALLAECVNASNYYAPQMTATSFVYINATNRVIYGGASYPQSVFRLRLDKWGVTPAEWQRICEDETATPHLFASKGGRLFYVFPCMHTSATHEERIGTVTFYLNGETLLQHLSFLDRYSAYSLFLYENGRLLFKTDELECAGRIPADWIAEPGTYDMAGNLAFSLAASGGERTYLLVLPQQEALVRLGTLRTAIFLILGCSILLSAGLSFFAAFRNGIPVNQMALTLSGGVSQEHTTNLNRLNASVTRVVEDNKLAEPALRRSFFHHLLKAGFVSQAEVALMARRANLSLTGSSYLAVALRLFPQVELSGMSEDLVARAGQLQEQLDVKLRELYPGQFWSYRRNIAVSLYILEGGARDSWDYLLETLTELTEWLEDAQRASACWGVGTPCGDLTRFWKSAEEAASMLELEGTAVKVRLYVDAPSSNDPYFLPYALEDRLVQAIRSGDRGEMEAVLDIIRSENVSQRSLNSKQFQKLNHRIASILREQAQRLAQNEEVLAALASLDGEATVGADAYFKALNALCLRLHRQIALEKGRRRSDKIQSILSYVHRHYSDPEMSLTMVGDTFGLTEAYLSTLFKAEAGVNFASYLERLRIDAACEMLRQGTLVAEVAQSTGYNSVQSFRRAFKRATNISPSGYRK